MKQSPESLWCQGTPASAALCPLPVSQKKKRRCRSLKPPTTKASAQLMSQAFLSPSARWENSYSRPALVDAVVKQRSFFEAIFSCLLVWTGFFKQGITWSCQQLLTPCSKTLSRSHYLSFASFCVLVMKMSSNKVFADYLSRSVSLCVISVKAFRVLTLHSVIGWLKSSI